MPSNTRTEWRSARYHDEASTLAGVVDAAEYERWHGAGEEALQAARLQSSVGVHNWACFLAQQAAQFGVKGLLHGLGEAPWGHDLVDLGARASAALGEAWPSALDVPLQRLSQFYIATRYPDANPQGLPSAHYGQDDSTLAIELAEKVLATITSGWTQLAREQ